MVKLENAFALDAIGLGVVFGKMWFPVIPEVDLENAPDTFLMKREQLAAINELVKRNDQSALLSVEGLRNRADLLLTISNPTVTQKHEVPEGISIHDYWSHPKYYWPDPSGENKYIVRDGEANPECYSDKYDLARLDLLSNSVMTLSLAFYFTNERIYAEKALSMIRTWFIDPNTRQTPHFQYAQQLNITSPNRFQGIIEARRLIYVCEGIQLLRSAKAMPDEEYKQCQNWFTSLLDWMENSRLGKLAQKADNNIGFWFDLQRIIYARICGKEEIAERVVRNSVIPKVNQQIDIEGRLNRELSRAKPYDYVAFTLMAMAGLSAVTEDGEIKLAEYSDEEGRSFHNALNWFHKTLELNEIREKGAILAKLAITQQEVKKLREEKYALEEKLAEREQGYPHSNIGVINHDPEFRSNDEVLKRITKRLGNYERECARLKSALLERQWQIINETMHYRGIDLYLKETAKLIRDYDEQVRLLKISLNESHGKLDSIERKLHETTLQLQERDDYIQELEGKLGSTTEEIQVLRDEYMKEKESNQSLTTQIILEKERNIERLEAVEKDLHKVLIQQIEQNKSLNRKLEEKRRRVKAINQHYIKINAERRKLNKEFSILKNSRSWKVTEPARKFTGIIKKMISL